uniref:Pathogen-related protein-like protein n=1 Tax=Malo kingi TaxID=500532 RepID=B1A0E4_9CNID|nr:pathogen-related protein-like protein [Malo kingi]
MERIQIIVSISLLVFGIGYAKAGQVQIITDKNVCLHAHNALRALHRNTPSMTWDYVLQKQAEDYAKELARSGEVKHSSQLNQLQSGENIFKGSASCAYSCAKAVLSWYNEIKDYDFNSPGFSSATGHFTQVVWRASIKVGVGVATVKSGRMVTTVIVGRYKARGNFGDSQNYRRNVLQRLPGTSVPSLASLDPKAGCNSGGSNNNKGTSSGNNGQPRVYYERRIIRNGRQTIIITIRRQRPQKDACADVLGDCMNLKRNGVCDTAGKELCKKTCNAC